MSTPAENVIVQVNRKGQQRVSTDGGKTWHLVESLPVTDGAGPKVNRRVPASAPPAPAAAQAGGRDPLDVWAEKHLGGGEPPPPPAAPPGPMGAGDAAMTAASDAASFGLDAKAMGAGAALAESMPADPLGWLRGGPMAAMHALPNAMRDRSYPRAARRGLDAPLSDATTYESVRDEHRAQTDQAYQDQPLASFGGALGAGLPAAIASGGGNVAPGMRSAIVEGFKLGGMFGAASGVGHTDLEQSQSAGDAALEAAGTIGTHAGLGAGLGAATGGFLEALMIPARALGRSIWQARQSPLTPEGVATQEAAAAGAEPAVFARGAIKPGPELAPIIDDAAGQQMLASELAAQRMGTTVDDSLAQRVGGDMGDSAPEDVEANRVALMLREALTGRTQASKEAFDAGLADAARAEGGRTVPMASVKEQAEQVAGTKYVQQGGRLPDPAAVEQRATYNGVADMLEGEAAQMSPVDDWLSFASEMEQQKLSQAAEMRQLGVDTPADPEAAELLYSPAPTLRQFAAKFPDLLDSEHLQTAIDLVQHRRKAAQAAHSPEQSELAKLEGMLIELREQHFPQTDAVVKGAAKRLDEGEAIRGSLGLGNKESFDPSIDFGGEVATLVSHVKNPTPDGDKAIHAAIKNAPNRAEILAAIERMRETMGIAKNARSLDATGDAARAKLGPDAARAGRMARGMRGYEKARATEKAPSILTAPTALIKAAAIRVPTAKNLPATTLPARALSRPLTEAEKRELQEGLRQ